MLESRVLLKVLIVIKNGLNVLFKVQIVLDLKIFKNVVITSKVTKLEVPDYVLSTYYICLEESRLEDKEAPRRYNILFAVIVNLCLTIVRVGLMRFYI